MRCLSCLHFVRTCGVALSLLLGKPELIYCQTPDSFNPGPLGDVFSVAPEPDGRVLVVGGFQHLGGGRYNGFGRLNADGSFDNGFLSPTLAGYGPFVVAEDGKILTQVVLSVGGGSYSNYLARLSPSGALDPGFTALPLGPTLNPPVFLTVYSIAIQPDGKTVVGGVFGNLGGLPRTNLARLNPNGTLDPTFNPGTSSLGNESVRSIVIQPDGKILVGGSFAALAGQPCTNLGRLNPDASLDIAFHGSVGGAGLPPPEVTYLALQADGGILVSGYFRSLSGQTCTNFGRLVPDGTFDANFTAAADFDVLAIAVQCNGKIVVGGSFATLDSQTRTNLGRLNPDGTLDPTFTTGIDTNLIAISPTALIGPAVYSAALCRNGAVVVGGRFINIGGVWRTNLARLNNTEPATESLGFNGSAVTWLRGGASPEVGRTKFAACTNGQSWYDLGTGTRIPGGWQLSGVTLTPNVAVRARGFVQGGSMQGAGWVVETVVGQPVITEQPLDQTNKAGTTATFTVVAGGTAPLSYWWNRDGTNLADGGDIYGARTPTLTVSNALHTDLGSYSAIVSNSFGAVTSRVATLTVIDPTINTQPVSQVVNEGGSVTFTVGAIGTAPLFYQWLRNGLILAGATFPTLVLTNLQRSNTNAAFQAVVTGLWGSTTSAVAVLTVNLALPDGFNPAPDSSVAAMAVQPDGRIVVGGYFSSLAGTPRNLIARVNSDGSLDTAFDPGTNLIGRAVYALALQVDGSILVGGDFRTADGQACLVRILPDGTRDTGFRSGLGGSVISARALAAQSDGKALIGGNFSTLGGQAHLNLGRINADGTVDGSFNPSVYPGVFSLALQADGRILVAGLAGTINGMAKTGIGRLNPDGTLDGGFGAFAAGADPVTNTIVATVTTQADGKILVGGFFQSLDGFILRDTGRIGRLNSDGTVDTSFNPGANGAVESLAVEADGRILVMGEFTLLAGGPRTAIGRLKADGSLDPTFDLSVAFRSSVGCALAEPDGRTLVGGSFDTIAGAARQGLARISSTDPVAKLLSFDGATITWLRSGPAPELVWAAFQGSTNGSDWFSLGTVHRVAGGWQVAQVVLPTNALIRARGYVEAGSAGGSTWFVEDIAAVDPSTAPLIIVNDGGFGLLSGQFGFNVAGLIGQKVLIEGSSDFFSWRPLATNTIETGQFHFAEPAGYKTPLRLYRARLQ